MLELLTIPDERLRRVSKPVKSVNRALQRLIKDMFETMYLEGGIGLAAIQVGVAKRVIVLDLQEENENGEKLSKPICMVNPVIKGYSKDCCVFTEGCLSIPGEFLELQRPSSIKVEYLDEAGREQSMLADGLLARAIQHESDHLIGKLLVDYLPQVRSPAMEGES